MKNFTLLFLFLSLSIWTQLNAQQRPDIWSFSAADRFELRQLMMSYITTPVVTLHVNGVDPVIGPFHNYREEFLTWHRGYIQDMEAYLLTQVGGDKFVPLPSWDPTTVIPDEFFNALVPPGNAVAPGWTLTTLTNQDPVDVDFSPVLNNLCSYAPSPGRTAIDNFALALESRHDPVHGNIGGIMGGFQSPASAIFWLWHAWIDDVYRKYECDCQGIDANDFYTKDSVEDIGNEANDETTGIFYLSSDIWVRNSQDFLLPSGRYSQEDNPLRHENPEYSALGNPNYVYVKVRNRGCNTILANTADLRVYWSKASTGLNWPTHFNNYFHLGILNGDELSPSSPVSIPAVDIAPGESFVVELPWVAPNPADFTFDAQHFCLLSRIESTLDPMTFSEVVAVEANTRNNNNIAWKNLTVVDLDPFNLVGGGFIEDAAFFVRQTFDNALPMKLVFKSSNLEIADGLTIDLDNNLLELILQSDTLDGMEVIENTAGERVLKLRQAEGFVGGLLLEPEEIYAMRLNFEMNCEGQGVCPPYGTIENLTVEQYLENDFADEFVGGNYYEVRIKQDEETICGDFPIVGFSAENSSCSNSADGFINLELEGSEPFAIFWDNGQTSQQIEGLLPGEYTATVRDAENCVNSISVVLTDKSDLELIFEPMHVTRLCDILGSINLSVEGGTPDYSVVWSNGSNDFNLEGLETGMYTATVTDGSGCEKIDSVNINQNFPLRVNTEEIQNASSSVADDGAISILVTGGVRPLTYNWSNGGNSSELQGLTTGDYMVTISDHIGCTRVETFTIDFASSVLEQPEAGLLMISPVPAHNLLAIDFRNIANEGGAASIEISNINGQLKNSIVLNLSERTHRINIESYPAGIYLIKTTVGNRVYVDKFIKQ